MRDRFDEQARALFPLATQPNNHGDASYVIMSDGAPVVWLAPVDGTAKADVERWAEMFRRPHAATLRQAHANARVLLAPAQAGGETGDYTDEEIAQAVKAARRGVTLLNHLSDSDEPNAGTMESARRVAAGGYSRSPEWDSRLLDALGEIRARRKPAPAPGPGDAVFVGEEDIRPECAVEGCGHRFRTHDDVEITAHWRTAHPNEQRMPVNIPDDATDTCRVCGTSKSGWSSCGNLDCPSTKGEPAPDAQRERAIRAVASHIDEEAAQILQRVEAGGREDELLEAVGERLERFTVAAVERALRDERDAAYQRGRADAAKPRPDLPDPFRAPWCCAAHPGGEVTCARTARHVGTHVALDEKSRPVAVWEDEEAREETPAGVLAVAECAVERASNGDRIAGAILSEMPLPADAPERVTVAVLTGGVAGIVEAHRALTECEHTNAVIQGGAVLLCINCGVFQPWNNGPAGRWQSPRLAAAVKAIK